MASRRKPTRKSPNKVTAKKPSGIGKGTPGPGRPKGSRNKASVQLREELEARGCRPQELLADIVDGKPQVFHVGGKVVTATPPIEMRADAAKALMPYLYAKLKQIDVELDFPSGMPALHFDLLEGGKS